MLKPILPLLPFVAFSHLAIAANTLTNYDDMLSALKQGHEVRAILALQHCTSENKTPPQLAFGGMNFTHFNAHTVQVGDKQKETIATSINMLVQSKQHGAVYNYVRLRVFKDNTAELYSQLLNPQNFSVLHESTFQCKLGKSPENSGVTLYDLGSK